MTAIAPQHLGLFLRERLPSAAAAQASTPCAAYAYAFKLLFEFATARFKGKRAVAAQSRAAGCAPLIMDFLDLSRSRPR